MRRNSPFTTTNVMHHPDSPENSPITTSASFLSSFLLWMKRRKDDMMAQQAKKLGFQKRVFEEDRR